jgi:hypothetical protein
MRHLTRVLLLGVFAASGAAQDKPKGEHDSQRCTPKLVSKTDSKSPQFHLRKGEVYRQSPIVAFEVLESGETAHAILKRKSGVAEVDKYALQFVHELKYRERPGCGTVETTADITIDFR